MKPEAYFFLLGLFVSGLLMGLVGWNFIRVEMDDEVIALRRELTSAEADLRSSQRGAEAAKESLDEMGVIAGQGNANAIQCAGALTKCQADLGGAVSSLALAREYGERMAELCRR